MKTNTLLLVMLCLALHLTLASQNIRKIERDVLFSIEKSSPDHLIKARITDKSWPSWRLKDDLFYSYYYNNKVLANQGGYYGQLLNGKFLKFNKQNLLIEEGHYKMGLQTGLWKYWDEEGVLIKQVKWQKGKEQRVISIGDEKTSLFQRWKYFFATRNDKAATKKKSAAKEKKPKSEKEKKARKTKTPQKKSTKDRQSKN